MADRYTLKIKDVVQETPDTKTIHFKQPLFKKVKYKPGQFLTLHLDIDGQKVTRSYSMSSNPDLDSTVAVTVKRVEGGLASNYINDHLQSGNSMQVSQPAGRFTLEANKNLQRHIVLFGAGSGITPLMSILKAVLFFEPQSTVSLVYGNREPGSVIFREQLDGYKQKFGERFNLLYTFTQPAHDWGGYKGRIDEAMCVNALNLLPGLEADSTEYYLCGPEGMMDNVKAGLKRLKVPSAKIYFESFTSSKEPAEAMGSDTFETRQVKILMDGEEYEITVPPDKSILDTALDEGLDMPFSCQSGLCTACMGRCKSGQVKMVEGDALSDDEVAEGYVLTCVGHPLTDDVVIEIE